MSNVRIILPNTHNNDTARMREFAEQFISQINEAMNSYENLKSLTVVVKVRSNGQQKIELTASSDKNSYRRELQGEDYYEILPRAFDEIEKAIYKQRDIKKTKYKRRGQKYRQNEKMESLEELTVSGNKKEHVDIIYKQVDSVPMSIETAIEHLEKVGHNFFLFKDQVTGDCKVVYHREEGGYGVLEQV